MKLFQCFLSLQWAVERSPQRLSPQIHELFPDGRTLRLNLAAALLHGLFRINSKAFMSKPIVGLLAAEQWRFSTRHKESVSGSCLSHSFLKMEKDNVFSAMIPDIHTYLSLFFLVTSRIDQKEPKKSKEIMMCTVG